MEKRRNSISIDIYYSGMYVIISNTVIFKNQIHTKPNIERVCHFAILKRIQPTTSELWGHVENFVYSEIRIETQNLATRGS